MISIILPSYNEQGNIHRTHQAIKNLLNKSEISYELIFVNDGSQDNTWNEISAEQQCNNNIKGICFSRNFGKDAAILSGLAFSSGDCCIVMDCDLQHPIETILEMYDKWLEGYEIVEGIKRSRGKENFFHKKAANLFYSLLSKATGINMANASDFKLLDRKVVDVLLKMPEQRPFFRMLSAWVGFKTTTIEFDVQEREIGKSKWSILKLTKYAVSNITSFSTILLQLITVLGTITLVGAIILGIYIFYQYILGDTLNGLAVIILLLLLLGSFIMIGLGIIGYYIARIYEEVQSRPRYIISEFLP